jgi:hypothetical protein
MDSTEIRKKVVMFWVEVRIRYVLGPALYIAYRAIEQYCKTKGHCFSREAAIEVLSPFLRRGLRNLINMPEDRAKEWTEKIISEYIRQGSLRSVVSDG